MTHDGIFTISKTAYLLFHIHVRDYPSKTHDYFTNFGPWEARMANEVKISPMATVSAGKDYVTVSSFLESTKNQNKVTKILMVVHEGAKQEQHEEHKNASSVRLWWLIAKTILRLRMSVLFACCDGHSGFTFRTYQSHRALKINLTTTFTFRCCPSETSPQVHRPCCPTWMTVL